MNKVEIFDNGYPLSKLRFNFLQDAIKEAIKGLSLPAGTNYILSGARFGLVGANFEITEGYVVLDGEVYKVDAENFGPVFANNPVFIVEESQDGTLDPTMYADGVQHNSHIIRRAVVSNHVTSPAGILLSSMLDYADNWHEPDAPGEPALTNADQPATVGERLVFKLEGNKLRLKGSVQPPGGGSTSTSLGALFTLPDISNSEGKRQYRPNRTVRKPIAYNNGTTLLTITSAGVVSQSGAISNLSRLYFDDIEIDLT